MINVNERRVMVTGDVDTVEMEIALLLTSIYDYEPESLKRILQFLKDYMDGKIELHRREIKDDSL